MHAALLHLDNALLRQSRLRHAICAGSGRILNYRDLGPALRLWSRPGPLRRLGRRLACALPATLGPTIVFSGSGDFHHVSVLLISRALDVASGTPVTVVHFDNHPDWVKFGPGAHCGSWVGQVARLPGVARLLTVGVCSDDIDRPASTGADLQIVRNGKVELYAYTSGSADGALTVAGRRWPTIEALGEAAFAAHLVGRITTEAIYITIDKDVLHPDDAGTNWDQGRTRLAYLSDLIAAVTKGRRLVGADVVGDWSKPAYGNGPLHALLKRGEAMLDQPRSEPSREMQHRNEAVNLALLDQLRSAA